MPQIQPLTTVAGYFVRADETPVNVLTVRDADRAIAQGFPVTFLYFNHNGNKGHTYGQTFIHNRFVCSYVNGRRID